MKHTTTIRTRRFHGAANSRAWLALAVACAAAAAAWLVFTRDVGWPVRARDARIRGRQAEAAANYAGARAFYEAALADNPYDADTHLRLARLLSRRLLDRAAAHREYLYALAYSPDPMIIPDVEAEMRILTLLQSGELEAPENAIADMTAAVEAGAEGLFRLRLDPSLYGGKDAGEAGAAHFRAWRERGAGKIVYSRVETDGSGMYDAELELAFPDGSSMSMHFRCPLRSIWKLSLSFP